MDEDTYKVDFVLAFALWSEVVIVSRTRVLLSYLVQSPIRVHQGALVIHHSSVLEGEDAGLVS